MTRVPRHPDQEAAVAAMTNPMQRFAAAVLERHGALVDPVEPEGLDALLNRDLQRALDLPEMARLGFGMDLPPGARRVGLDGDWLERLSGLMGNHGRTACMSLSLDAPAPATPEALVDRSLELTNAVHRFQRVTPTRTRCLLVCYRYTALSDEKRDGLLPVGINLTTGVVLDGIDQSLWSLALDQGRGETLSSDGPGLPLERVQGMLAQVVPHRVHSLLAPFLASMRRRLGRDIDRLYAFHADMARESAARLAALPPDDEAGPRQKAERQRETQKLAAVEREYVARIDDLRNKYAVKVTVDPVQALVVMVPVYRMEIMIRRRKAERLLALDWHPSARRLEPAPCEDGWNEGPVRTVCDTALHLVSPAGHADCPACGKSYCRACHPKACPRCASAGAAGS